MTARTDRARPASRLRRALLLLALATAAAAAFALGCASGGSGQPHMRNALEELRGARAELDLATADKGGHRVRAMSLVDEAISEVQLGMDYARGR